ncbi:MAG: AAA family ATPase [Pseudomonadota bacterium]
MSADEQFEADLHRDIVEMMRRPETYGVTGPVLRKRTQIADVFLTGEYAYKIKKPLALDFLDFSTCEKRLWALQRELELNKRTAPDLYDRILPITVASCGKLDLNGAGRTVDWTLRMRQFDESKLLSNLADDGALALELVDVLVRDLAVFHRAAEAKPGPGGAADVERTIASIRHNAGLACGPVFEGADVDTFCSDLTAAAAGLSQLLDVRRRDGCVRVCHGDLHLKNIFEEHGRAVMFDCIEFSERLALIDILYDLAFLLMDLDHRGLSAHANRALNGYFENLTADEWDANIEGLAALPLFLAMRAGVRAHSEAHVEPLGPETIDTAYRYLKRGQGYLQQTGPVVVAVGGVSGAGKSTAARAAAPYVGAAPGAFVLRSDEIRKRRHGLAPTEALPPEMYTREESARTYETMFSAGARALAAGRSVVFDAVFLNEAERDAAEAVAEAAGAPFFGFWLEADPSVLKARVAARTGDASDADVGVLERQLERDPGEVSWRRIDAGGEDAAAVIKETLALCTPAVA